jgi:hypothetical protein
MDNVDVHTRNLQIHDTMTHPIHYCALHLIIRSCTAVV